ncbi:OmpA family protein [Pseudahrensia aquimaris]|uniref:OmpA family protein n=1 Tax=Pseudahrensia aquimaris TaxID=744461 RepID=A0ABW3FDD3_9HYPH
MCHWKKWIWPGLLTVGLLSLLALYMKADVIEADLKAKATAALAGSGLTWAGVEMDGRDATLTGVAPSEDAQDAAEVTALNAYDVRVIENQSSLLAAQSPYTLTANRDGDAVTLSGFVPNDDVRETIVNAAKEALPGTNVTDQMTLARGAPEGLAAMAGFGMAQLNGLTTGEMSLSDSNLSVKGVASSFDTFNGVNAALDGVLPAGATLAMKEITPPSVTPYTWGANYSGTGVTLSGYVPSTEVGAALATKAGETLGVPVTDEQVVAGGSPDTFQDAAGFALDQLPRFTNGNVGLSNLDLTVEGVAKDSNEFSSAKAAVAGALPAGMVLAAEKIVPSTVSPYTWNADFDGSKVTLGGYVPDQAVRDAVVAQTRSQMPGFEVIDQMQIAAGAPSDFTDAARFGIDQLPRFQSGDVSLADTALTVNGVAKDPQAFDTAKAAVAGDLPAGLALASEDIRPATITPYTWSADYDGAKVVLDGYVPDDATRASIVEDARAKLPGAEIVDDMAIAAGAPSTFREGTQFALDQLPRFTSGNVALSDTNLAVEGVARDPETFDVAKAAVAGALPSSLILNSERIVPNTVSPYEWGADYDGRKVTLSGFVPDERARATIVAATRAQLPNAEVVDDMKIANGAPETFSAASVSAVSLLPRFSEGDVALSDLNLTVNGKARSPSDFTAADGTVKGTLDAGMSLAAANIEPAPDLGDYVWSAERRGSAIILAGNAPSMEARKGIADRAKALYPDATVVNRIVPREDAPAGFIANADKGLALLDRLSTGKASISNRQLSIEGQASSVANYENSLADIANNPDYGYSWDVRDIKPVAISPYTWALEKGGDTAVQSGFVPNRGTGNSLVAATRATLGKDVDDRQRVALGEPENFGNAVAAAISAVNKLDNSRASITDTNMFVQGRASSEEEADRLGAEIEGSIPENFKLRKQISYPLPAVVVQAPAPAPAPVPAPAPEPAAPAPAPAAPAPAPAPEPAAPVCQIDFRALFAGEKILFATNRALINEQSNALLDRIAAAMKSCPDTRFEIGGHTDSRGRDAFNQALSEARAQAVLDYLTNAGVSVDNLAAKGFGETSPVASNRTVEGRAANRRIEFNVIED